MFELSGFLHSRQGAQPKMLILPTVLGPCCMLLTLSLFAVTAAVGAIPDGNNALLWTTQALVLFIGMYVVMAAIRDYFRSIATLEQDLRNFTIDKATCFCCQKNHPGDMLCIAMRQGCLAEDHRPVVWHSGGIRASRPNRSSKLSHAAAVKGLFQLLAVHCFPDSHCFGIHRHHIC